VFSGVFVCLQHMPDEREAQQAIRALDGSKLNGSIINVEVNILV